MNSKSFTLITMICIVAVMFSMTGSFAKAQCPLYKNCSECLANPSCGWCQNQSICLPIGKFPNPVAAGELTGQVLCAGFLRSNWITTKAQCGDAVCTGLTCDECQDYYSVGDECHWCSIPGLASGCYGPDFDTFCGALGGFGDPAVCPAPNLDDPCLSTLNCTQCLANNCSFCDLSGAPGASPSMSFCIASNISTAKDLCISGVMNGIYKQTDQMLCFPTTSPPTTIFNQIVSSNGEADSSLTGLWVFLGIFFCIVICICICIVLIVFTARGRETFNQVKGKMGKKSENNASIELATDQQQQSQQQNDGPYVPQFPANQMLKGIAVKDRVGGGKFGDVYRGTWLGTTDVALKKPKRTYMRGFESEVSVFSSINFPHVVKFLGIYTQPSSFADESEIYLVMEFMSKGALDSLLQNENFSLIQKLQLAKDAAAGCNYLSSSRIIHRDLALRNLLVTEMDGDLRVKLSDFGLARKLSESVLYYQLDSEEQQTIPTKWSAPEVLSQGTYYLKSDVFSFGVVLWELFSGGKRPYPVMSNVEVKEHVLKGERLQKPDEKCPENVWDLIKSCWNADTDERPAFSKLLDSFGLFLIEEKRARAKEKEAQLNNGGGVGPRTQSKLLQSSTDYEENSFVVQNQTTSSTTVNPYAILNASESIKDVNHTYHDPNNTNPTENTTNNNDVYAITKAPEKEINNNNDKGFYATVHPKEQKEESSENANSVYAKTSINSENPYAKTSINSAENQYEKTSIGSNPSSSSNNDDTYAKTS